jgi:hypothetical protein
MWVRCIAGAQRATPARLYGRRGAMSLSLLTGWRHDELMPDNTTTTSPVSPAARRSVLAGLWMFFAGAILLLFSLLAQVGATGSAAAALADRFPDWPTWIVPESAAGYTMALMMVCWGVLSLGRGLQLAREASGRR